MTIDTANSIEQPQGEQSTADEQLEEAPHDAAPPEARVHYDQPWLGSLLRPFLIAILAACLTVALMAFLRHAIPGIPLAYTGTMVLLGIVAALIGCVSTTWLAQPAQRTRRNSGYRAAEFALLLGITRLVTWATVGYFPPLRFFFTRPIDALLDGPFIISALIVLIAWYLASAMTSDFLKMGLQPDELHAARQRTGRSTDDPTPPNYTDRRAVLAGFLTRWLSGGILLVILAAGTQVRPSANGFFALGRQNIAPSVITAVVIYFLVGLVLLSQGQLAVLRARWTLEKVPSTPSVLRSWPMYALALIGGIGVIATLLPFGGTFYLAQIFSSVMRFIYTALLTVFQAILGVLLVFLALLTGEQTEQAEPPPPPAQQPIVEPPPPAAGGPPEWLGGALFWICIALLLGYAAYIYLSGRGVRFTWLKQFWLMLRARWMELFGAYQEWQMTRVRRKQEREAAESERSLRDRLGDWLRPRHLDPDQQVRYYYLSTLERAERAGLPRRPSETPSQYAPRLMQKVGEQLEAQARAQESDDTQPDSTVPDQNEIAPTESDSTAAKREQLTDVFADEQAVVELTDAFLHVRYAGQHTTPERVPLLKQFWEAIKRKLR